ncbi:MAG: polyprenyl synthetase family protein [Lachnospiraceae bacterium]|nr:polyprenyl synthetase family protein [Lachnospiraceae bacterium]
MTEAEKNAGLQERLKTYLTEDLQHVEAYLRDTLVYLQLPLPMRDILEELLSVPGKQIRPMLSLLAGHALKADTVQLERISHLGALIEIVHLASLVHDDVVDDAPLRRGRPTTQGKYGKNIAVYTGDFLLSRVLSTLLKDKMNRSGEEIAQAVEEMCLGETAQMQARFDADVAEEQYLGFIRGKTVALFVAAFRIAGLECGVSDAVLEKLTELGHCFGYVFQLRDDLKDYLSAQEEEGKAVHADIRAGYYTMPLLRALHTEQGNQIRALLQEAQTGTDAEAEAKLQQVLSFVRGTDAFSYTKERIDAYAARGPSLLSECPDMEAAGLIGELMIWLTKSIAA